MLLQNEWNDQKFGIVQQNEVSHTLICKENILLYFSKLFLITVSLYEDLGPYSLNLNLT